VNGANGFFLSCRRHLRHARSLPDDAVRRLWLQLSQKPLDSHDRAGRQVQVPSHGVVRAQLREALARGSLAETLEKFLLFRLGERHVARHEGVVRDRNSELDFREVLYLNTVPCALVRVPLCGECESRCADDNEVRESPGLALGDNFPDSIHTDEAVPVEERHKSRTAPGIATTEPRAQTARNKSRYAAVRGAARTRPVASNAGVKAILQHAAHYTILVIPRHKRAVSAVPNAAAEIATTVGDGRERPLSCLTSARRCAPPTFRRDLAGGSRGCPFFRGRVRHARRLPVRALASRCAHPLPLGSFLLHEGDCSGAEGGNRCKLEGKLATYRVTIVGNPLRTFELNRSRIRLEALPYLCLTAQREGRRAPLLAA
jgi:hypothetical protein